ncbi:rifin [Plasmodium reichenowi]|uniref:Rifin n=1 Tax=Plasmodium reichenowi TaxID=5854 RepID=A0A060RQH0_PLARE|nr:rifin [Plasmodium reichenowi]
MKVHYFNILLFALPLNILVKKCHVRSTQKNPSITQKIPTTRRLCECDPYMPNYDNDLEMKEVMDNFSKQTLQRFHEYDERLQSKRKQCKDKCDKEIQKIILKDKIDKELMDKFSTLQTDIQSDAIPTCVCEKSMAEKVEKGCLRCAQNLGGIVVPSSGVIGEIGAFAVYAWKTTALDVATKYALTEATKAATRAGVKAVKLKIQGLRVIFSNPREGYFDISGIVTEANFNSPTALHKSAMELASKSCKFGGRESTSSFCSTIQNGDTTTFRELAEAGSAKFKTTFEAQKGAIEAAQEKAIETTFMSNQTAIIASIVAIVVIVLIMVIIYLILRYRRKKKMKKKLQK